MGRHQRVRTEGAWLPWVRFFLEGVRQTAEQAVSTARSLLSLFEQHRDDITKAFGARAGNALMLHDAIKRTPYVTALFAADSTKLSLPTVNGLLDRFREIGIIVEVTGRKRDRKYLYRSMITLLESANVLTR